MIVFWDTSALLPLVVKQQPFTNQARKIKRRSTDHAVAFIADLEATAALHRLRRQGSFESDPLLKRARASLARLLTKTDVVSFAPSILGEAKALVSRYPLRALDSLQLACCKELVTRVPEIESLFVTADGKLAAAARNELSNVILLSQDEVRSS